MKRTDLSAGWFAVPARSSSGPRVEQDAWRVVAAVLTGKTVHYHASTRGQARRVFERVQQILEDHG